MNDSLKISQEVAESNPTEVIVISIHKEKSKDKDTTTRYHFSGDLSLWDAVQEVVTLKFKIMKESIKDE
jgi:hypothetical protein